jgi:hypothetical protein
MPEEPVWNFAAWCGVALFYALFSRYFRPSVADVQARETFSKPFIVWSGPLQLVMLIGQLMLGIGLYLLWLQGGWAAHYGVFAIVLTALVFSILAQYTFWTRCSFGLPTLFVSAAFVGIIGAAIRSASASVSAGILLSAFGVTNLLPLSVYFTVLLHRNPLFEQENVISVINTNGNANAYVFAQDPEEHIILGPPVNYH